MTGGEFPDFTDTGTQRNGGGGVVAQVEGPGPIAGCTFVRAARGLVTCSETGSSATSRVYLVVSAFRAD